LLGTLCMHHLDGKKAVKQEFSTRYSKKIEIYEMES